MLPTVEEDDNHKWVIGPDNTLQIPSPYEKRDSISSLVSEKQNWRGVFISLAVIFFLIILIMICTMVAIPLLAPPILGRPVTLELLKSENLKPFPVFSQWISNEEVAYFDEFDGLVILNVVDHSRSKIIPKSILKEIEPVQFSISYDKNLVLLFHDVVKDRLFKRTAKYTIYDISAGAHRPLKIFQNDLDDGRYQHVEWMLNPGNSISRDYLENNQENLIRKSRDLKFQKKLNYSLGSQFQQLYSRNKDYEQQNFSKNFYFLRKSRIKRFSESRIEELKDASKLNTENFSVPKILKSKTEKFSDLPKLNFKFENALVVVYKNNIYTISSPHASPFAITNDGEEFTIFNGVPDLMNEEIMERSSTVYINPGGSSMLYLSLNSSRVDPIPTVSYGNMDDLFVKNLRYPTVLSEISKAVIKVVNIIDEKSIYTTNIVLPVLKSDESYIVSLGWIDASKFWVSQVSRNHKISLLYVCKSLSNDWSCKNVHTNSQTNGAVTTIKNIHWSGHMAAFPWASTKSKKWHNSIAIIDEDGRKYTGVKPSCCHVQEVMAFDVVNEVIFFIGSEITNGSNGADQLYSVSLGNDTATCLSCRLNCAKVSVVLNAAYTHAVVTCLNTHLPFMHVLELRNDNFTTLLNQTLLSKKVSEIALPVYVHKKISLPDNTHASVTLSLPPGWMDGDTTFFYSLIIQLFGIENYEIDSDFNIGLQEILASSHYIAHAQIKLRNNEFSQNSRSIKSMADSMQKIIEVLLEDHKFLDRSHISIWGWGSGASMSMKLSESGLLNLKCVMAVNPVMDWYYYGSYWSERNLGSKDSVGASARYEESNTLRALDSMTSQILLMQSFQDPLSHHSFGIAQHLISKGVYFQHIVYPGASFTLRENRHHVIKSFLTFVRHHECVKAIFL